MAKLSRRAENAVVEAVGEDATAPAERAVEAPRETNGKALHRAGERTAVVALDDEMHVVALHRELDDARAEAVARLAKALQYPPEPSPVAKVGDTGQHLHGHEHWYRSTERSARGVRHAPLRALGLASGSGPSSAMRSEIEGELLGSFGSHPGGDDGRDSD